MNVTSMHHYWCPQGCTLQHAYGKPFPVQRDCDRAACRALGMQCEERRAGLSCREVMTVSIKTYDSAAVAS